MGGGGAPLTPPTSGFPAQIQNVRLGVSRTTHFEFGLANQAIPGQAKMIFLFSIPVAILKSYWLTSLTSGLPAQIQNVRLSVSRTTHFEFGLANQAIPGQAKAIFLFSIPVSILKSHWLTPPTSCLPAPNSKCPTADHTFRIWAGQPSNTWAKKVIFLFSTLVSILSSHWLTPPISSFPAQIQNVQVSVSQTTHFKFGLANQAVPEQTKVIFLFSTLVSIVKSHSLTPPTSDFPAQIQNVRLGVSRTTHFEFGLANQAIPGQAKVIFPI